MEDLRLLGTLDITDVLSKLDALDKRIATSAKSMSRTGVVSLKTDVALKELGALEKLTLKLTKRLGKPLATQILTIDATSTLAQLRDVERLLRDLQKLAGSIQFPTPRAPRANIPSVPTTPGTPLQDDAAKAEALKVRIQELQRLGAIVRNDFIAAGTAVDATEEEIEQATRRLMDLQKEMRELRPLAEQAFGKSSAEVKRLTDGLAQTQRTISGVNNQMSRLGLASQVKLGIESSGIFNNPQGYANGIVQVAQLADKARLSNLLFRKEIENTGQSFAKAEEGINRLVDRLNLVPETTKQTYRILTRFGYSAQQAEELMLRVGASALAAGKDANGAIEALADDVQRQTTIMLNSFGVTANQATAYQQYAKALGTTADALDKNQKAEAFLVAIRRETQQELGDIDDLLNSVSGTLGETNRELQKAQKNLGEALIPLVTNAANALAGFLKSVNGLPGPLNEVGNVAVGVGAGLLVLGGPIAGIIRFFKEVRGNAPTKALTEVGEAAANSAKKTGLLGTALNTLKNLKIPALAGRLGAFGAAFGTGFLGGTLINGINTSNGLEVGQNIQNFFGKLFFGQTQEMIDNFRIVENQQRKVAEAVKKTNQELANAKASGVASYVKATENVVTLAKSLARLNGELDIQKKLGTNPERVKELQREITATEQALKFAQQSVATEKKRAQTITEAKPKIEELRKLQTDLAKRSFELRISAKSDFAKDMAQIEAEFREEKTKLEARLKGEKNVLVRAEIRTTLDKLDRVRTQAEEEAFNRQIDSDAQDRLARQRTLEQQRVDLMRDGRQKREAELALEVKRIQDEYGPKIREALENAQAAPKGQKGAIQATAGGLQRDQAEAIRLAREARAQAEAEATRQAVQQAREAQQSILTAQASAADEHVRIVEARTMREVALTQDGSAERVRVIERTTPLLLRAQQNALAAQYRAARSASDEELRRALQAAETAGSERARVEAAAREKHLVDTRALEEKYTADATGLQLTALQTVQAARASATKAQLDRDLAAVRDFTGAQLASYQQVLTLKRQAALDAGDAERARVLGEALRTIEDVQFDNLKTLQTTLRDSAKNAQDLRERLADLTPKGAREQAVATAVRPFNDVIRDANTQRDANRKAFLKLSPADQAKQRGAYEAQYQSLAAVARDALQRGQAAALTADAKFQQARADKATDATAKLARSQFDQEQVTLASYERQLDAVRTYWEQRQALVERSTGDEGEREQALDTIRQKLADVDTERTRAQQAAQARRTDSRALAREELQTQLELAQTDTDRTRLREQLVGMDRARLTEVQRELVTLRASGGTSEAINTLERERLTLVRNLNTARQEETRRSDELLDSQLRLNQAAQQRAQTVARTNASIVQAMRDGLTNTRAELRAIEDKLASAGERGLSQVDRNALLSERAQKQGEVFTQEKALRSFLVNADRETLDLLEAQVRAQAELSGAARDAVASKRLELDTTRRSLANVETQLRDADRNLLTEEEVNQLRIERLDLLGQEARQQQEIRDAERTRAQQARELDEARLRTQAQLAGVTRDAVRSATLDLDVTRQKLAQNALDLRDAERNKLTQEDITTLKREQLDLLLAEQQAQQQVVRAALDAQQSQLDLLEARQRAQAQLTGLADDAVSNAELDVDVTRRRLALLDAQIERSEQLGLSGTQENDLLAQRATLTGQLAQQERALTQAQRDRVTLTENLAVASLALASATSGGPETPMRDATENLASARLRLAQAERQYADAQADLTKVQSTSNLQRFQTATETLTGAIRAQRDAIRGVADAYRAQLSDMDSVRDATARLRAVIQGREDTPVTNTNLEVDRLAAIQARRDAALRALQDAITKGDAKLIAQATESLAQQQDRYEKQAKRLTASGLQVNLSAPAALQSLLDQLDQLGVTYDREALNLQARADAAQKEAEAAVRFDGAVQSFAQTVTAFLQGVTTLKPTQEAGVQYRFGDRTFDSLAELNAYLDREDARVSATPGVGFDQLVSLLRTLPTLTVTDVQAGMRAALRETLTPELLATGGQPLGQWLVSQLKTPPTAPRGGDTIDIDIHQQPGQSADDLLDELMRRLRNEKRREGRNC